MSKFYVHQITISLCLGGHTLVLQLYVASLPLRANVLFLTSSKERVLQGGRLVVIEATWELKIGCDKLNEKLYKVNALQKICIALISL